MFGDMNNANSPLIEACRYKTEGGIGMGSSLADLEEAFGKPSSIQSMGSGQMVQFIDVGATFMLSNDRVIHMMFQRPRPKK